MTGKDLIVIISQNGTALASTCIRSQEIQTSADTIEKASATQQNWKEYVAGRTAWSMNVSYLVLSASKVADLLMVGQTFDITMKEVDNTSSVTGTAILMLRAVYEVFEVPEAVTLVVELCFIISLS